MWNSGSSLPSSDIKMAPEKNSSHSPSAFQMYNKKKLKKMKTANGQHSVDVQENFENDKSPSAAVKKSKAAISDVFELNPGWDDSVFDSGPVVKIMEEVSTKKKKKKTKLKNASVCEEETPVIQEIAYFGSTEKQKRKKKKGLSPDVLKDAANKESTKEGQREVKKKRPHLPHLPGLSDLNTFVSEDITKTVKHGKKRKRKSFDLDSTIAVDNNSVPLSIASDKSTVNGLNEYRNDETESHGNEENIPMLTILESSSDEASSDWISVGSERLGHPDLSQKTINVKSTKSRINEDSIRNGREVFKWLIHPEKPEEFFSQTWEVRPVYLQRNNPSYFSSILSTPAINQMLVNNNIQFTKNLDITSYVNGKRETLNPDGRAYPAVVWDHYSNGCSIRLLNPQTFIKKIHVLNATLQEYFGCFVGANAYLTPPDSQGFAPHYDDIEAFILQIEGKKHWKLYAPRTKNEVLPRFSSNNFTDGDIGEPIMEVTLEAGDLLYFPRGVIHQGRTLEGSHSLHVTLSVYQRNSWGDFMEKLIPAALQMAIEEDVTFRKGLPLSCLDYMGVVHSDKTMPIREKFKNKVKELICKLVDHAPVDAAMDQMAKQFMHDALPPVLSEDEKERSAIRGGLEMTSQGKVRNHVEIDMDTKVKLLRAHVLRLVSEEDVIRIYHNVENSLEYHGSEAQYLEIDEDLAPAVEYLINSYPKYVAVTDLPLEQDSQKIQIVNDLWERGLLLTEDMLQVVDY